MDIPTTDKADKAISSHADYLEKSATYSKNSFKIGVLGLLGGTDKETANQFLDLMMENIILGQRLVNYADKIIKVEAALAVN